MLYETGPLLIAANHPNSFLDAVIIASLFRSPVYSLARGDAFAGKMINRILTSLNMFPVYRISEGAENIGNNYTTFDACQKLFKQNKAVLIFSEGRCINEWRLRPLKKGTARLAIHAWENNIPLKVLPLGINYSSFRFYGKNVIMNFGAIISGNDMNSRLPDGRSIKEFNEKLQSQLKELAYEINPDDKEKQKQYFYIKHSLSKKIILFFPAIAGGIVTVPLLYAIHLIIRRRAKDHYDSIVAGLLFFLLPLYVPALTLLIFLLTKNLYAFLLLALLPFTMWSYLQLKRQMRD